MARPLEEIEDELLALPETSRAELAARLIHSLNGAADANAKQLWIEEAKHRADAVREGRAYLYSVAGFMQALSKRSE